MSALSEFRRRKDEVFRSSEHSPIPERERREFEGLRYFPENPDLVVTATLDPPDDQAPFTVVTSTGDQLTYRRAGRIAFSVDGEPVSLSLLASDDQPGLFLPFRDATSGRETYGAGRYLDLHVHAHPGDEITVDFNYAYNPSCAYDDAWSCPLPPPENWLQVPIRAGEQVYRQH